MGPAVDRSTKTGTVTGSVGFFGPPEEAADGVREVAVGYGLVAPVRGHGAMTEALTALLALLDAAGVRDPRVERRFPGLDRLARHAGDR